MIVPFPLFEPDKSRFNSGATDNTINCKPTADGWGPFNTLNPLSGALPTTPLGSITVKADDGLVRIFVGTTTNLYEISTSDYTLSEISKSTGAYAVPDGDQWSFAVFGNNLVATALGTVPQFIELNAGSAFADLTGASFQAKYVATVGDFLVFGYMSTNNRIIRWSGINDMTFWTNGERGADEQEFPDGGNIQGILTQTPNALIAQANSWRRMLFDPSSDYTFLFEVINPTRGVYAPRSMVNIGLNDFVYLSTDGFFRGVESIPIGAERVDRWFKTLVNSSDMDLTRGVADPYEKIVWWRFNDGGGTGHLLGYDWQLDRWCYSTQDTTDLLQAMTTGYTVDNVSAFGNVDTIVAGPDSQFWVGGVPGFAGWSSAFKFGFFDGATLAATLETEDKQLNYPRRAITDRASVLVDNDSFTVAIASKETPKGTLTYGSDVSPESGTPWVSERVSGRYHRFKVKLAAGATWSNAVGVDTTFRDGGMW